MAKKRSNGLTITTSGTALFIQVPAMRAMDLQRFLRGKGVATSPPSPCTSETDSIELRKGTDVEAVQAMLDQWT